MHIERTEPSGAAAPIGVSVSGNITDASHVPGMRTVTLDTALWKKAHPALL